mmetsp:Transcript_44908/g.109011  ORF Transcript_44908/g.109011 Transcript_44908/m.109011 type:complete len:241 (-) Transcript_44908:229-951(-)
MNNDVISTAPTPANDNGANANNDFNRHNGYNTVPVSTRIQNCLDVQIPAVAAARPATVAPPLPPPLPCNNVCDNADATSPNSIVYDKHAPKQKVNAATDTTHAVDLSFLISHNSPNECACEICVRRPYKLNVYADNRPNIVISVIAGTNDVVVSLIAANPDGNANTPEPAIALIKLNVTGPTLLLLPVGLLLLLLLLVSSADRDAVGDSGVSSDDDGEESDEDDDEDDMEKRIVDDGGLK